MSYEHVFLGFLVCLYSPYFVWSMLSLISLIEDSINDEPELEPAMGWPLVTVAVPLYNEGEQFTACIDALLCIEYPHLELIVVDDGSTDASFEVAQKRYGLYPVLSRAVWTTGGQDVAEVYRSSDYPTLSLYRQPNCGKAGALNTALRFASGRYFLTLDADSIPGRFSLKRMVTVLEENAHLVGASGVVRLRNGCDIENGEIRRVQLASDWLSRFQTLEYLRAFLIARIGMSVSGGLIILSGAFALLRTTDTRSVHGFNERCIGEDFEICLRLLKHSRNNDQAQLAVVSNANCWTIAPENRRVLYRQRERWQRGCLETLWTHRHMFLSRKNFRLSWLCLPAFVLFEALTPIYELLGFGFVTYMLINDSFDWVTGLFIVGGIMVLNVAASLIALLSETVRPGTPARLGDVFALVVAAFAEPLFYRPINALPRITGSFKFLFSTKQVWGDMERSKSTSSLN
jgi:cellulose synthase/poly-beta-1,6-N-acetylglucosamine synthase-like glycosyltransferase